MVSGAGKAAATGSIVSTRVTTQVGMLRTGTTGSAPSCRFACRGKPPAGSGYAKPLPVLTETSLPTQDSRLGGVLQLPPAVLGDEPPEPRQHRQGVNSVSG